MQRNYNAEGPRIKSLKYATDSLTKILVYTFLFFLISTLHPLIMLLLHCHANDTSVLLTIRKLILVIVNVIVN
jgi:hypothetical protein